MTKCQILGNKDEGYMKIVCSTQFSVNLKLHQNTKLKLLKVMDKKIFPFMKFNLTYETQYLLNVCYYVYSTKSELQQDCNLCV